MSTLQPRGPRYGAFIGTGCAVGVLAAMVLALIRPASPTYERGQVALYLALLLGFLGGLLGGGLAVLLDARAERRR